MAQIITPGPANRIRITSPPPVSPSPPPPASPTDKERDERVELPCYPSPEQPILCHQSSEPPAPAIVAFRITNLSPPLSSSPTLLPFAVAAALRRHRLPYRRHWSYIAHGWVAGERRKKSLQVLGESERLKIWFVLHSIQLIL